jgi:general nucleoside transport system permease protein
VIRLEKRPEPSRVWTAATPVLAVVATMIAGGIMFAALGKDPVAAIRLIFWDPLFNEQFAAFSRPQLLVKAGPLILIATGSRSASGRASGTSGPRGSTSSARSCGAAFALAFYPSDRLVDLPRRGHRGRLWRLGLGDDPGDPEDAVQHERDPRLAPPRLRGAEHPRSGRRSTGSCNPEGAGFPGSRNLRNWEATSNEELIAGTGMHWGVVAAFAAVIFAYILLNRHIMGFNIRVAGQSPGPRGSRA